MCFFLLTRLLSNGWTSFHQIFTNRRLAVFFINGGTPWKSITPFKKFGAQNVYLDGRCAETRRNFEKTKTAGITTTFILPSQNAWWNSVWRHLSYRGLRNHAFWPMGHSASLNRQYLDNGKTCKITNRSSQKVESMAFPTVYSSSGDDCPVSLIFFHFFTKGVCRIPGSSYKSMECNGVALYRPSCLPSSV